MARNPLERLRHIFFHVAQRRLQRQGVVQAERQRVLGALDWVAPVEGDVIDLATQRPEAEHQGHAVRWLERHGT